MPEVVFTGMEFEWNKKDRRKIQISIVVTIPCDWSGEGTYVPTINSNTPVIDKISPVGTDVSTREKATDQGEVSDRSALILQYCLKPRTSLEIAEFLKSQTADFRNTSQSNRSGDSLRSAVHR